MIPVVDSTSHPGYRLSRVAATGLIRFLFRWRVVGSENVPESGAVVLCCNHIHNFDPPILGASTTRFVHFLAKEELFRWKPMGAVLSFYGGFPLRRGVGDRRAIRYALSVPESGGCLAVFPEGHRSRDGQLGNGQPGVAMIARRARSVVVPCAIIGPYRFRGRLTVRFGEPVLPTIDSTNESLLAELMLRLQDLLDQGHEP